VGRGSYLGGSTIIRADVHGPLPSRPTRPKKTKQPRPQGESQWLAANKRSLRNKPVDKNSPMEIAYRKAIKRRLKNRRKRAKK
jgi:hypothetical protein